MELEDEALRIAEAMGDEKRKARLLRLKSVLVYEHGDLVGAARLGEQAVAANIRAYGEGSTQHAANLLNLGSYRDELGDTAAARLAFERAYRIYLTAYGPDHPDTLLAESNVGSNLRIAKDFAAADPIYADVLARVDPSRTIALPRLVCRVERRGERLADLFAVMGEEQND
jgi:hypothetical protein